MLHHYLEQYYDLISVSSLYIYIYLSACVKYIHVPPTSMLIE